MSLQSKDYRATRSYIQTQLIVAKNTANLENKKK